MATVHSVFAMIGLLLMGNGALLLLGARAGTTGGSPLPYIAAFSISVGVLLLGASLLLHAPWWAIVGLLAVGAAIGTERRAGSTASGRQP